MFSTLDSRAFLFAFQPPPSTLGFFTLYFLFLWTHKKLFPASLRNLSALDYARLYFRGALLYHDAKLIFNTSFECLFSFFLHTGVEVRCIGHFKLLFSLLRLTGAEKLQKLALEVISTVTGNGKCVASIAEADVLAYLLLTLHTLPSCKLRFF